MKIVAWIGAGFMLLSAVLYTWVTWFVDHTLDPIQPTMDISFVVPMPFSMLAVPLMIIGGLIARPKYYYLICFFAGIIYFLVFFPITQTDISHFVDYPPGARISYSSLLRDALFCILPALLLLIEGIILYIKRDK